LEELKKFLLDSDLSIEQYFILSLLNEDIKYLEKYLLKTKNKIDKVSVFQDLLLKGFITLKDMDDGYILHNIILTKDLSQVFDLVSLGEDYVKQIETPNNELEEKWREFITLYPKSVNGRPLHNTKEKNRLKYFRYLKSGLSHEDVMKGLQAEIEARKGAKLRAQFFPEWQLLSTYINNKSWEQFVELKEDIDQNKGLNFDSNGRITRTF